MDDAAALAGLRAATGAMAELVREVPAGAPVPACPGWDVTTLVDHLGRVHLWAEHCARTGREPQRYPRRDRDRPLADWYAACATTLVTTLAALPPDHSSWSFSALPEHQFAGFWRRRQFHETTVHRVDALQAVGKVPTTGLVRSLPGVSAGQAADGVGEVFEVMAPRALVRHRSRPPEEVIPASRPVAFVCTDTGDAWTLHLDGGEVVVRAGRAAAAVAEIGGPAVHLYLSLWHRAEPRMLGVQGDEEAARRLLAASLVP